MDAFLGCCAPALVCVSIVDARTLSQLTCFAGIAFITLNQSQYIGFRGRVVSSWLAFDFRCLHVRQAVEAFRDLAGAGGELIRVPALGGKGARAGGPGRDGDMAGEFCCSA